MVIGKKLSSRAYLVTHLVIALIFADLLVFGPALRMGKSFTAGLLAGVAAGWIVFAIAGAIALRRGAASFDERRQVAFTKAAALSFWILVGAASLAAMLLRSESLAIELDARELAALFGNLGFVSFALSWFIAERRG